VGRYRLRRGRSTHQVFVGQGEEEIAQEPAIQPAGANVDAGVAAIDELSRYGAGSSLWRDAFRRLARNRLAIVGLIIIVVIGLVAIFAPYVAPYRYDRIFPGEIIQDPSSKHLMGTNLTGQDTLSRIIYGARNSLSVGIFVQFIILSIAVLVGGAAALGSKWLDTVLMRFTDIVYAFPDLLFVILLQQVLATRWPWLAQQIGGLLVVFLAIGLVSWVTVARLIRGQMLSLKERDFVLAARAMGATRFRIVVHHMLPHTIGPVIVALTFGIPAAIFTLTTLSVIGIGIQPPLADWGNMIYAGYGPILTTPWPAFFPAMALAIVFISFQFLGDGLRDALDPRTR
jgi:oligopeptide transport system permease protein